MKVIRLTLNQSQRIQPIHVFGQNRNHAFQILKAAFDFQKTKLLRIIGAYRLGGYARPMAGLELPECFAVLRRRLEAEREGDGTREYIRVLRLLENHRLPQLRQAVEKALAVGAMTRDAIAQFLTPQPQWRHTVFRLDGHPHLRGRTASCWPRWEVLHEHRGTLHPAQQRSRIAPRMKKDGYSRRFGTFGGLKSKELWVKAH